MSDERIKKSIGVDKAEREQTDRASTDERELDEAEYLERFRATLHQSHLPDVGTIHGYHLCWLTTNNPRDSITQRLRLGYELVKADEVPGFELTKITSGDYTGFIGVNEMVLAKLPDRLYQLYMREVHERAPDREEEKMNSARDQLLAEAKERGITVKEGREADTWA